MIKHKTNKVNELEELRASIEALREQIQAIVAPEKATKAKVEARKAEPGNKKNKKRGPEREAQFGPGIMTMSGRWLWFSFPERPSDKVIRYLKSQGARWSWRRSMWYITCRLPQEAEKLFDQMAQIAKGTKGKVRK